MRVSIWKELIILIAVFVAIWFALSYFSFDFAMGDSENLLSAEKESEIADMMLDMTLSQYDIEEDSAINATVNVITKRLLDQVDSSQYNYTFRVIKNAQVNAFATLGGNIFIFTGLIEFVESPEELAMILAHEIGHVEQRHVVDKLIQQLGMEALFSIITGGDPLILSEVSKLLVTTSFDRKKEKEADDFAFDLALKSKINPHRMAQFFIRTLKKGSSYPEQIEIIMTHPHSNARVKKASEVELPEGFEEEPFEIEWDN